MPSGLPLHLQSAVLVLHAGRDDRIVDTEGIARGREMASFAYNRELTRAFVSNRAMYCSFCGKERREVAFLVAGPRAFICAECVVLCAEIVSRRGQLRTNGVVPTPYAEITAELNPNE